jgi:DNA-directed RNA polymerase subunit N (RpoN/RPB10)
MFYHTLVPNRVETTDGVGAVTPPPPSLYLIRYMHTISNMNKIFECLGLKNYSCRNFDKFMKILLTNFTNYGKLFEKLVKNAMSGNFFTPPPANNFGKRNIN